MAAATIFTSVFGNGGGTSRYGDYTVVRMSNSSFITTPIEFHQISNWARGRGSSGVAHRDRTAFVERFETVIGRSGSAVATKGNRSTLSRIVKSMKANSMMLTEWSIPRDLDAGVEVQKRPAALAPAAAIKPAAAITTLTPIAMPLAVDPPPKAPA